MNYKIAEAARTGRYHAELNQPCQDRIKAKRAEHSFCAAVADGAGSRADSQIGAECAVEYVSEAVCGQFEVFWKRPEIEIARLIVDGCLDALTRQELPIYNLASTLLFFAAHEDGRFLSGNLGDGVQIWKNDETLSVLSHPENGEYQNQTVFLTSNNAAEHLRVTKGHLTSPGGLLMMSDGMAESLYQRDTGMPARACATLIEWLEEGEEDVIAEAIGSNMDISFSKRSGDDLSLVVVTWDNKPMNTK